MKPKFGEWLCSQAEYQGDSATARSIRKLARLVKDDDLFPRVAVSYSTYYRWLIKHYRQSDDHHLYQLTLSAAYDIWEALR